MRFVGQLKVLFQLSLRPPQLAVSGARTPGADVHVKLQAPRAKVFVSFLHGLGGATEHVFSINLLLSGVRFTVLINNTLTPWKHFRFV